MSQAFEQSIPHESSWCEVSAAAIRSNVEILRRRVGEQVILGIVVKSDAYGHGLIPCAEAFLAAGADWLVVNFAYEAVKLRQAGISAPIYICGNVSAAQIPTIAALPEVRIALYDSEIAQAAAEAGRAANRSIPVHIKIETGTHRQGLDLQDALKLAETIAQLDGIVLEGIATHYADIEDTTDHRFAHQQLDRLQAAEQAFRQAGFDLRIVQSANSAATILWQQTHASMVRVGIAAYGLWPSKETYAKVLHFAEQGEGFIPDLQPVLSWRARVVQVKAVPTGGYVGYGRTFRAPYPMQIAVLPVGYHEGYDRRLSNLAYVLINGRRAPVCGRICMNMMMVDVTHIPQVQVGSVATLLGSDGDERVSAEQLASWMGTINYEVVARIHPSQPRYLLADTATAAAALPESLLSSR